MNVKSLFLLTLLFTLTACQPSAQPEDDRLPTLDLVETPLPADTPTPLVLTGTAAPAGNSATPTATEAAATATLAATTSAPALEAAATPSCQAPAGWVTRVVEAGDTLFSLAQRSGTSVAEIKHVNCLAGDTIYAGQTLFLPRTPAPRSTQPPPPTSEPPLPPPPMATPSPTSEAPPPPGPGDPSLAIAPFSGPVGTQYTVTLLEFAPGETVTIVVAPFPSGAALINDVTTVDASGTGVYHFVAGQDFAPGLYVVVATGVDSGADASANFQVTESATATPTPTPTPLPTSEATAAPMPAALAIKK